MTEQTTPHGVFESFAIQNATPAQRHWAQKELDALNNPIASITVRLLSLTPGDSEIEYNLTPSGPLAGGAIPPGYPGYNKDAYEKAYQVFVNAVKRELDRDFLR